MELTNIKDQFTLLYEKLRENLQPFLEEKAIVKEHEPKLEEDLNRAYREWKDAQNYFNNATEPELIEHASYLIGAAERKYMYLLRRYKEKGVNF